VLKVLDTIPEGEVYLIPVRLDECDVPSKLNHLHWVDYFAEGGQTKLLDALQDYLVPSTCEPASVASGPLKFSRICIDANDPNWVEDNNRRSPFDHPYSQHFRIVEWVHYGDPLFDITVINTAKLPAVLTAVGIEIMSVCQIVYCYGLPTAGKIPKSNSYVLELPNIRTRMHDQLGTREYNPQEVRETITTRVPDPIYLEPNAPYRYGLFLKNYYNHVPNWARIRICVSTDLGQCQSAEIETFTL
jgi:hypothetical protein